MEKYSSFLRSKIVDHITVLICNFSVLDVFIIYDLQHPLGAICTNKQHIDIWHSPLVINGTPVRT